MLLSHFSRVRLCVTPGTIACLALPMGILQARILEWVAMLSPRGSSQPKDRTQVSRIQMVKNLPAATKETQEYWSG